MPSKPNLELPQSIRPWVNLLTYICVPLFMLGLIVYGAYVSMHSAVSWVAPRIDRLCTDHTELVDALKTTNAQNQATNLQNSTTIKQQIENNSKFLDIHEKQTAIMQSMNAKLDTLLQKGGTD